MNICYFSAQYLPTVGGVERYTWNLAKKTAAAGHRAIVVTSALPGLPAKETDPDGITILRLPVWPVMNGRFPVLRPGREFSALSRALWEEKIDFCVIQTRMYVQSVWAARESHRRGIPALVIDHSTGYMPMGGGVLGAAGRLYEQLACRMVRSTGVPFYGVSAAACRWLKTFGITAAGTMPNAVDLESLHAEIHAPDAVNWRERLSLGDKKIVAFAGRLIPEKGALLLAQAVAKLPNTVLLAAGSGPDQAELEALGAIPLGALPHDQVVQLLAQADVYCLPTRYAEGFPTTLLEAAACGCPIVCTATAGTEELLPGPEYGTVLPGSPADLTAEQLRAALSDVLNDPDGAHTRAQAAYRNLCGHFTWDAVFAKIMEIIKEKGC
ncbi:MAG: glycosyltransferase family 4 protein [Oscillospiraceae bacterium]|nr:glycosyltransferase family 4 protein [Oscillospiraceae bacterium]